MVTRVGPIGVKDNIDTKCDCSKHYVHVEVDLHEEGNQMTLVNDLFNIQKRWDIPSQTMLSNLPLRFCIFSM